MRHDQRSEGALRGFVAQLFGRHQIHAAHRAVARLVADHLGVHRRNPLARQLGGHHPPGLGDLRHHTRPDEYARPQPPVGVVHVDAYIDGARRRVQGWIDERDAARECFVAHPGHRELDVLAETQPRQIAFVGFEHHPDLGQVRDGVEPVAFADVAAGFGVLIDHHAADRGVERHVVGVLTLGHPSGFGGLNLLGRQPQQAQTLTGRVQNRLRRTAGDRTAIRIHPSPGPPSFDQFLSGHQQIRAVNLGQVVALAHPHAGVIDVHAI